jgi:hypothetical protein
MRRTHDLLAGWPGGGGGFKKAVFLFAVWCVRGIVVLEFRRVWTTLYDSGQVANQLAMETL